MKHSTTIVALVAGVLALATIGTATAQDSTPILYVTEWKIQGDRVDSLRAMTEKYSIPWQEFIASKVDGYRRFFYTHDTGGEANFVTMTMYPDWDYVYGDEIDLNSLFEEYKKSRGISDEEVEARQPAWNYLFEGASHVDNILRPIAVDGD